MPRLGPAVMEKRDGAKMLVESRRGPWLAPPLTAHLPIRKQPPITAANPIKRVARRTRGGAPNLEILAVARGGGARPSKLLFLPLWPSL